MPATQRRQYSDEERAGHRAFAEAHWPWALTVARDCDCNLDWEERRSVAYEVLCRVARAFDPSLGYSPTTYIRASIRRELLRAARADRLIGAPPWVLEAGRRRDRSPECAEAARRTALVFSLDREFEGDSGATLRAIDSIAAPEEDEDEDDTPSIADLRAAIGRLPRRLAAIVRGQLAGRTFRQIGAEIGCSKERARQLHGEAVRILRKDLIRSKT